MPLIVAMFAFFSLALTYLGVLLHRQDKRIERTEVELQNCRHARNDLVQENFTLMRRLLGLPETDIPVQSGI